MADRKLTKVAEVCTIIGIPIALVALYFVIFPPNQTKEEIKIPEEETAIVKPEQPVENSDSTKIVDKPINVVNQDSVKKPLQSESLPTPYKKESPTDIQNSTKVIQPIEENEINKYSIDYYLNSRDGIKLTLEKTSIDFFNYYILTDKAKQNIDKLIPVFNEYPDTDIGISSYIDVNDDNSLRITYLRSKAVKKYLIQKGISVNRLDNFGMGYVKQSVKQSKEKKLSDERIELFIVAIKK